MFAYVRIHFNEDKQTKGLENRQIYQQVISLIYMVMLTPHRRKMANRRYVALCERHIISWFTRKRSPDLSTF